jgi:hypothetical protein
MDRRHFILGGAALAAAAPALAKIRTSDPETIRGDFLDLTTGEGNMTALARINGNTDMKSTKYGWAQGIVQGVRPGEAVRDLCGFTMMSCARLLPYEGGTGYRKVLREVGLYTDLKTGEIIEEWTNPYFDEKMRVVPIANDPFNQLITPFAPKPPAYGGLIKAEEKRDPMLLNWQRRGDKVNLFSYINLFYPSSLPPEKWPRENGNLMNQVTETFLYTFDWADIQNPKKTSVSYGGTWSRVTPWLPWMLMGPTPGHCIYNTFMGAGDSLDIIDKKTLAYVEKNFPKYLEAPTEWVEPSLSSLEWFAREQTPAPVPPGQPVPRAPEPKLPPMFKKPG